MKFLLSQLDTIEPTAVVAKFSEHYSPRTVLDIGAGTGKNAIYLAQHGYTVTASDRDEESVSELKNFIEKEQIPLTAKVVDLKSETPEFEEYGAVIFSMVLHYLRQHRSEKILQQAIDVAKKGDVHMISAVTTEGDFAIKNPDSYYPEPQELQKLYEANGWKIIEYYEKESNMRALRSDGTQMRNLVAHLIAEKVR